MRALRTREERIAGNLRGAKALEPKEKQNLEVHSPDRFQLSAEESRQKWMSIGGHARHPFPAGIGESGSAESCPKGKLFSEDMIHFYSTTKAFWEILRRGCLAG